MSKDVYDYLAKESVSDLTITHLDASTSSSAVDRTNVTYWGGPITLSRVIEASRTYPHGFPIPEASSIKTMAIANAASDTLKPDSPGLYQIVAVFSSVDVTVQLVDGTSVASIATAAAGVPFYPPSPLIITPTLYLQISNASGGEAAVGIPYHTVGL